MYKEGLITDLKRQERFLLIPAKKPLRKAEYVADFVYKLADTGEIVVEDAKGVRTDVYKLKKKLMFAIYGILIKET